MTKYNNIKHSNNNNTINTINNTINIVPFGKEDIGKICDDDDVKKIMNRCNYAMQELVKKVHFNKDHPENHNVYISNIKSPYTMIYKNNKWNIDDTEEVIDKLYDDKYMYLEDKYYKMKDDLDDIIKSKMKRMIKNTSWIRNYGYI
mgnify:CR=1 FL=1